MLVHTVFFWLKEDISDEDLKAYLEGMEKLTKIPSVAHGFFGKPSSTDRPVIDRSYSYGLTIVVKDMAAHDEYQDHPDHDDFRNNCAHCWDKVVIYDYDTE